MASDPPSPSEWALTEADRALNHAMSVSTPDHNRLRVAIARAFDDARLDSIAETETLIRDQFAARGVAWPTEPLDFGAAVDLALVRALSTAHAAGFRAGVEAAAKALDSRALDEAALEKNGIGLYGSAACRLMAKNVRTITPTETK